MGRITLGRHSYGSIKVIGQRGHIHVGNFTSIADNVGAIMLGHNPDNVSTFPFNKLYPWKEFIGKANHPFIYGDVHIGNDCWIGYGSIIMGGVTIHDGAIVAAGSVVTNDLQPYTVNAGVPTRQKRLRFSPEIIWELLQIKWWDWTDKKIIENVHLLCNKSIDKFIELYGRK